MISVRPALDGDASGIAACVYMRKELR